jgi:ribosomal protein L24E
LVGTRDGTIYIYDPILISNAKILSFNNDKAMPFFKARRPEIVRWVEPVMQQVEHISRDGKTKEKTF